MKRVLFVVDECKLGGVSILLEDILNNINLDNLDITLLILHKNGTRLNNLNSKIKVIYGGKAFNVVDVDFKALLNSGKIIGAMKKIALSYKMKKGSIKNLILNEKRKLGITDFDVEIAFKSGFCSLFVGYGDAKKKINWVHEDYASYNKTKRYEETFKEVFKLFDKHVVVSNEAAQSFINIYGNKDKTIVIENYIDTNKILGLASKKPKLEMNLSKTNIVTLGRFSPEKGFDRLIEGTKKLSECEDISNLQIYIVGYGDMEKYLKSKIKEYGLENNIQVINNIEIDGNAYSFMKQADAYFMTSSSESFGMVRVEALVLGLPVVTTNVANTKNMIDDSIGIVVENSTNGILDGLKQLNNDKERLIDLKKNVSNYSYEDKNREILNKITELLEG